MAAVLRPMLLALLVTACGPSARSGWRTEPPAPRTEPCGGEAADAFTLVDSAPGRPPVRVMPTTLDVVAGDPAGVMVDRCGEPTALVRRTTDQTAVFLPLPPDLSLGLTSYDIDPTGTRIAYVAFDGERGARLVVRTLPDYRVVAQSRRVTVPPTDAQCGYAVMGDDGYWEGYICLDDVTYVWFRNDLGSARVTEDTVRVDPGASPIDTKCLVARGDYEVCAARAAGYPSLAYDSTWSFDREVRFWDTGGRGIPSRLVIIRQRGGTVQGEVLLLWPTSRYLKNGSRDDRCGRLWMTPRATACVARRVPTTDWAQVLRNLDAAGLSALPWYPVWPIPCEPFPEVIEPVPPGGFVDRLPRDRIGCFRGYEGAKPWLESRTPEGHWEYHFQVYPDPVHPSLPRDRALLDLLFCTISEGPRPCPPRPRGSVF